MSWMHHPFVETFLQHQYRLTDLFFLLCFEAMAKILYAKGNSAMTLPTKKCMRQDVSKLLSNDDLYLLRLQKKKNRTIINLVTLNSVKPLDIYFLLKNMFISFILTRNYL